MSGPNAEQVLVGRPLAKEISGLQRLLVTICAFGVVSLLAWASGAWWLARRIVGPPEQMTHTAE